MSHSLAISILYYQTTAEMWAHGPSRRSETRNLPYSSMHESEPDVFQDQAVMATCRRYRWQPSEDIDGTGEQIKEVLSVVAVTGLGGTGNTDS